MKLLYKMYSFHDYIVNPSNIQSSSRSRPLQRYLRSADTGETLTQVGFGRAVMLMTQRAESKTYEEDLCKSFDPQAHKIKVFLLKPR